MQNKLVGLMGQTGSSAKEVSNHKGTIEAGVICRLKSDDTLSVAKADGGLLGVSLGKDLSDMGNSPGGSSNGRTAICRKGLRVPVKLTAGFDPAIGAVVNVSDTTGLAIASGGGATAVNAVYVSPYDGATIARIGGTGVNGGVSEASGAGSGAGDIGMAFIDFPGGL